MPRELLPFAFDASQENITSSSQLLSTDAKLSQLRKREFPTSDSLEDFASHKRFHDFTDDSVSESLFKMNSSPPIAAVEDLNDDFNEDDDLTQLAFEEYYEYREAVRRIQAAIDNGSSNIKLEDLGLQEIPEEFGDLVDLVTFHPSSSNSWTPTIHAYLSNNALHMVNPVVFDVSNLTVLTLRNNRLHELPPAIGKLINLRDLSIGGNRLECLPIELMDLERLQTFSAYPNPFFAPPNGWDPCPTPPPTQYMLTRITVESHIPSGHGGRMLQSLSELCMKVLSDNILGEREQRRWNLAPTVDQLVSDALDARRQNRTCGVCKKYLVRGVGHVYEWWDGFKGTRGLVFKRSLCSYRCYARWRTKG